MNTRLLAIVLTLLTVPVVAGAHPSAEHKLKSLSKAIAARPDAQELYVQRGAEYSNDGQLELALADLRKAETLGEPFVVAFYLGVVHYRMGKLETARAYFDTFLERFPGHPPSLEYRARVSRDSGDYAAALADWKAYFAIAQRPNPGDYVSAAKMLTELDGVGIDAALVMLDDGMERLGVIPQLQSYAIELELEQGDLSGAIARHQSLEASLGGSPDWKVDMGELLLRAGKPEQARQHFSAASAQLESLRKTRARQQVLEKLRKLEASLGEPS
jgi:tetratricopeptide (TPR) repeat protein